MISNYLKTAIRHLGSHKLHLVINIIGLGIAIAVCIVSYLIWNFNEDYDAFHEHKNDIYRVNTIKAESQQFYGVVPAPMALSAKEDIAGIRDAFSIDSWSAITNVGENTFWEVIHFADPGFLDWFSFPMATGIADLDNPGSIVLSESMAVKYFGQDSPLGQIVSIYADSPSRRKDLKVTGILQDIPLNSSIQIDFITSFNNQIDGNSKPLAFEDWKTWRDAVFLVLEPSADKDDISPQLNRYVGPHNAANPDFGTYGFRLEAVSEMAGQSSGLRWNALSGGVPVAMVWGNIVMAILLLLTACLNFANMTVSLSGKRLKEIGIRKVLGSSKKQLVVQIFSESFLICVLSSVLGVVLSHWIMEAYNRQWPIIDLDFSVAKDPFLITFLVATTILTTLMAGAYPALYISSFNPNSIFQGSVRFGGTNLVSRILLGTQVTISLIAIAAGLSFARNAYFQENADMGFLRTGIQAVYTGNEQNFEVLKNEIDANPTVLATAGVRHHIGDSCPRYEFSLRGEKYEAEYMTVGREYMELMEINTVAGRDFNYALETDFLNAIIVNEKFVETHFTNEDPIGQTVTFFDTLKLTIVGVVPNFMQDSFFDPVRPMVLKLGKEDQFLYLAVRSQVDDEPQIRDALAAIWKRNYPMKPFLHNYQNDFIASSLMVTNNIKWTMIIFAIITVLLTITGLFALMSLNILKRTKEIAVRRVLGATSIQITILINRIFFWIVLAGLIFGCGIGGWLSATLLDMIFEINSGVSVWLMALAGIVALMVILGTIGLKTAEVMHSNPAEILKNE